MKQLVLELKRGISICELKNLLLSDVGSSLAYPFHQNFPHIMVETGVQDLLWLRHHPTILNRRRRGTTVGRVLMNFFMNTTCKTS
jgi:hypothetical protein